MVEGRVIKIELQVGLESMVVILELESSVSLEDVLDVIT